MEDPILFERNDASGRHAVFDEHDGTLWLYLTEKEEMMPIADVWVRNSTRSAPIESDQSPPPAPTRITKPAAHDAIDFEKHEWAVRWSADGNAVVLLMDKSPVAFIQAGHKYGWNRDVIEDTPWGQIWEHDLYKRLFGK